MYLFFNGVSSDAYIALISPDREIISSQSFEISGNESTKTIPIIDHFLSKNSICYENIENIITVVWPGSFTGIRTISLVVNTLAYIYPNIHLTPVNFFDLFTSYPIVKSSSKRDLFVKYLNSATIEIITNTDFEKSFPSGKIYGDVNLERFENNYDISRDIDYTQICKDISFMDLKKLSPLYIKKPNIS